MFNRRTHGRNRPQQDLPRDPTGITFLSQEREIQRLRNENQTLQRHVEALRAQLEPSERRVEQVAEQLKQRDRLANILFRKLSQALREYQNHQCLLEDMGAGVEIGPEIGYASLIADIERDLLTGLRAPEAASDGERYGSESLDDNVSMWLANGGWL